MPGDLESFEAVVPLPEGEVRVSLNKEELRVLTTAPGGTLVWNGERQAIIPGEEIRIER